MTASSPTYDLVILLDPDAEEQTRAKIIADTRAAIDASGEVLRHDAWGNRALSYPIQRRSSAEYHLLQFRAASPELLSRLNRSLRITDGILRFRIIKLKPGVPEPPDMASSGTVSVGATGTDSDGSSSAGGGQPDSSGGSEGSAGVTSGGDAPASAGDPAASASDPAASASDPAASASDTAASGGDAVTGGAGQPPEPGAAGPAEGAERVQAGST